MNRGIDHVLINGQGSVYYLHKMMQTNNNINFSGGFRGVSVVSIETPFAALARAIEGQSSIAHAI